MRAVCKQKIVWDRGIYVTSTQEKWDKAKGIIKNLLELVSKDSRAKLNRKQLERDRGFLIHIARTYTQMVPYLKGIHHTLEEIRMVGKREVMKSSTG